MALALSSNASVALQCPPSSQCKRVFSGHRGSSNLVLPRLPLTCYTVAFSRRRNKNPAITSKRKKRSLPQGNAREDEEEDDEDVDAFEALFSMLEEDLKNDDLSVDEDDDEMSEGEFDELEDELEALGVDGDELEMSDSAADDVESDENAEEDDEDGKEKGQLKLKNWQLRRLASALKTGRRKISIKNLAGDVCLDRAVVLKLLRDPPPNLLLMCATLPDDPTPAVPVPQTRPTETIPVEITTDDVQPETEVDAPVHVMQQSWSARKRLKKVQVETLERVYRRSRRPTDAMISSIVQVTNLPRKRIIKWFEDRRTEDGVPDQRLPYQRFGHDTVFSS